MVLPSQQIGTQASESLTIPANTIAYGLGGDDTLLTSIGNIGETRNNFSILVGGSGADQFIVANNSTAVILDNGNSAGDVLVATGIGFNSNTTETLEIDNRHFLAYDTASGQSFILIDWQDPANTIESLQLGDGTFNYDYIASNFRNTVGYKGSFTLEQADLQFLGGGLSANGITSSSLNLLIDQIKFTDITLGGDVNDFLPGLGLF